MAKRKVRLTTRGYRLSDAALARLAGLGVNPDTFAKEYLKQTYHMRSGETVHAEVTVYPNRGGESDFSIVIAGSERNRARSRNATRPLFFRAAVEGERNLISFPTDGAKEYYLKCLKQAAAAYRAVEIVAYAIVDRRAFFVVSTEDQTAVTVKRFFASVNTAYSKYYNETVSPVGHVFRGQVALKQIAADRIEDQIGQIVYAMRIVHNMPLWNAPRKKRHETLSPWFRYPVELSDRLMPNYYMPGGRGAQNIDPSLGLYRVSTRLKKKTEAFRNDADGDVYQGNLKSALGNALAQVKSIGIENGRLTAELALRDAAGIDIVGAIATANRLFTRAYREMYHTDAAVFRRKPVAVFVRDILESGLEQTANGRPDYPVYRLALSDYKFSSFNSINAYLQGPFAQFLTATLPGAFTGVADAILQNRIADTSGKLQVLLDQKAELTESLNYAAGMSRRDPAYYQQVEQISAALEAVEADIAQFSADENALRGGNAEAFARHDLKRFMQENEHLIPEPPSFGTTTPISWRSLAFLMLLTQKGRFNVAEPMISLAATFLRAHNEGLLVEPVEFVRTYESDAYHEALTRVLKGYRCWLVDTVPAEVMHRVVADLCYKEGFTFDYVSRKLTIKKGRARYDLMQRTATELVSRYGLTYDGAVRALDIVPEDLSVLLDIVVNINEQKGYSYKYLMKELGLAYPNQAFLLKLIEYMEDAKGYTVVGALSKLGVTEHLPAIVAAYESAKKGSDFQD